MVLRVSFCRYFGQFGPYFARSLMMVAVMLSTGSALAIGAATNADSAVRPATALAMASEANRRLLLMSVSLVRCGLESFGGVAISSVDLICVRPLGASLVRPGSRSQ